MPRQTTRAGRREPTGRASGAGRKERRALLYACFVASGAAGLILEIVWSKYLSLLLGNSIYGVSTVVAAFLGGLGIGAVAGGRIAERAREPLAAYAILETVIGALGLLSPLAYLASRPLFAGLYGALGGAGAVFLVLRFLILFAALLLPTIAMGATLPLLASDFTRRGGAFGSSVGTLYAFNTAGAVAGVASAGFILIPGIGLWRTALAASLLDFGVASVIGLLRPAAPPEEEWRRTGEESAAPLTILPGRAPAEPSRFARWIVPLFALSGFTAILYEIAWTRILSVPLGGMVYALSAILALYLLGIALGSAAAARVLRITGAPILLFAVLEILLGACVALEGHIFGVLPHLQASLIVASGESTLALFTGEAGIAALVVFVPTLLLGALFPTAAAIHQRGRRAAGASVGTIYAANTAGSIAGSLLTGFVLIPWIGALGSILAAAAANVAIGITALVFGEGPRRSRLAGAAGAGVGAVLFALLAAPAWPAERMSLGFTRLLRAYRWPQDDAGRHDPSRGERLAHEMIAKSGTADGPEKLRFYREGRVASVAVLESPGRVALVVNGKPDATTGSGEDMMTQVMLGQMPLLLARRAEEICIVGYGSGVTTHAVLTHPVREALTIELERAVIDAAPLFRDDAFDPLSDPRARLRIEDAGTFLRSTSRRFDVIVSEPSNPWIAGVGDLFTREFYEASARRLTPGGLFCQWVQCYEISPATLATILRTLASRFGHGQVFYFPSANDLVIVASPEGEVDLDPARMEAAFDRKEVSRDLDRVGVSSAADILRYYRGRLERVARDAGPGPLNTDDNGWLEHRAPLDMLLRLPPGEPLAWSVAVGRDLASSLGSDRVLAGAFLTRALDGAIGAGDIASARGLGAAIEALGGPEVVEARRRIEALENRKGDLARAAAILREVTPIVSRAIETSDPELASRAVARLEEAKALDPDSAEIAWRLGIALSASRRLDEALAELRRALKVGPGTRRFGIVRELAIVEFRRGELESCLHELGTLDEIRPGSADARYWRARVLIERKDAERARAEIAAGLLDHPNDGRLLALRKTLGS